MGFNRRKMEDQRRRAAEKEAAARRATDAQVLEDAEHLIAAWNDRQAERMPMLFSPTIGAAIAACYWFLWVRCPACRTINAVDLRTLDRHRAAAITSTDAEIAAFCERTYGITFPIFAKIEVNGKNAHPVFRWLRWKKGSLLGNAIKWKTCVDVCF
jgi:hypothetical protein